MHLQPRAAADLVPASSYQGPELDWSCTARDAGPCPWSPNPVRCSRDPIFRKESHWNRSTWPGAVRCTPLCGTPRLEGPFEAHPTRPASGAASFPEQQTAEPPSSSKWRSDKKLLIPVVLISTAATRVGPTAAYAAPPQVQSGHVDLPARDANGDGYCVFPVSVDYVTNQRVKEATNPDGSTVQRITGYASATVTNLSTSKSLNYLVGGPGVWTFLPAAPSPSMGVGSTYLDRVRKELRGCSATGL